MNFIGRSWRLFRASWAVLQANRSLTAFPAASALITIVVSLLYFLVVGAFFFLVPGLSDSVFNESSGEDNPVVVAFGIVVLFIYYLLASIISTYLGVALAANTERALDGGKPTVQEGLAVARQRLSPIIQFSALNAVIGVISSLLRGGDDDGPNLLGTLMAGLIEGAWSVITFLVVPIIAIKGVGAVDAIKESTGLLRRTFGEQLAGTTGMGLVFGVIGLLVFLVGGGLTALLGELLGVVGYGFGIIVLVIAFAILGVISATLTTIYKVAVYRYAETGSVPEEFEIELISGAFKPKNKRGI